MNRRIRIFATIALAIVASHAVAQAISIAPVEDEPGAQASLTISLSDAGTNTTALQFNLSLPNGITLDKANIAKEAAASEHDLAVRTLEGGDYLFVLYNMDNPFFVYLLEPLANYDPYRIANNIFCWSHN